jgi:hypothetical protein
VPCAHFLLTKLKHTGKALATADLLQGTCSQTADKISQRPHGIALWTYIIPMPFLQSLGVLHNTAAFCELCELEQINFVRWRLQDLVVKRLQKPSLSEAAVPSQAERNLVKWSCCFLLEILCLHEQVPFDVSFSPKQNLPKGFG